MPQVATPRGRAPEPHDGMVRRGRRQPGAVIMSAGRVPRIASALIPASPAGPGRRPRSPRSRRARWRRGYSPRARATSGQCPALVRYMRVWMMCSRLRPGWPSVSPVSRRHAGAVYAGPPEGAATCPQARSPAAGHQTYRHLRDVRYGQNRCRPIAPGVPSRVGSAGVILRGWELITRAGWPPEAGAVRAAVTLMDQARARKGRPARSRPIATRRCTTKGSGPVWTPGLPSSALPDPPALCRHPGCPGPGDGLARGWLWRCRG